jgi:hydrogenase maturation protease
VNPPALHPAQDTLVLGIGNPWMGDDGAGIRVAELLTERVLPHNIKVAEAGLPGWGLPSWLEGWPNVILVDAVRMGLAPGKWKRFDPRNIQVVIEDDLLSLHQPDLACGLALAQALGILPKNLSIYGIEPAATGQGAELSDAVRASLPEVVENILNDLEKKQA